MRETLLALLLGTCLTTTASAATSAYWRHEGGLAGGLIPAGPDTVLDSSGNGNHMRTFDPAFTSATYTSTVSPVPLRSGLANTLSLDFGPGGDDAGLNDDNYNESKPLGPQPFNAITVEVAFRMDSIGGYQAILGKDGKPTPSPVPPFKVLVRGDGFPNDIPNQLFVEWIDGDGDIHFLAGGQSITAGVWNHVAVTINSTDAALWVAGETGPYQQAHAISGDFAGASGNVIITESRGWSIGRGMFNDGVADWTDAHIDEARISDVVLAPNQFLFDPIPEPATGVMAAVAFGVAALHRRRRIGDV